MVATQVEPNGWPFGLEKMNIWLRVNDAPHSQVDTLSLDPSPLCVVHSPSLSSFSSSNLDTESTMSFFVDQSVSLGRLIGMRPEDKRKLYFPKAMQSEMRGKNVVNKILQLEVSNGQDGREMGQWLCVPLLHNALEKISRSKGNNSKYKMFNC
ncbi:PREDICTED: uncharacterized protein LOC109167273 isoform X1 [Ipomoea nil]|uniref:uncharacterized protein LOC109167273 isoform X1 n=1 Tax=Ipomoea nil TaxID=35883 RepID=UPI000901244E|nr:PREDICTED: uncharacterized protein LOC109167273 isoform X1 [Ipomoea nil]